MGKLHGVAIIILEVFLDILGSVKVHALLIGEDTNLDLLTAGAVRASEELVAVVVLVDGLALKELGGVNVSVLLHVLDLVAGVHAVAVVVVVVPLLVVGIGVFLGVFELTASVVAVLVTGVAHVLLGLLGVLDHGLEVVFHDDGILAIVVGAVAACGAKLEDDEVLDAKDGARLLVVGHLIVVHLDELALLEAEGVAGDVGDVLLLELTDELVVLGRLGTAHETGHVVGHGLIGLLGLGANKKGKS
mmetsp:Transcript_15108/g.32908  ORF Transcript_15108/g.32908 Transcript_15108/m.32908 type:complete len:246 (-) Transcript_15108:96-833(-)